MGIGTHIAQAALLAASLSTGHASADTVSNPLYFFATCAGRLSAELSYQWMVSDPAAAETEAVRAAVLDIVAALTPEGEGRGVLSWRVEARAAHSALLSRAVFHSDDWARSRADQEIAHCRAYIVGPVAPVPTEAEPADIAPGAPAVPAAVEN
ncbi:hypothetical protein HKCCE2091_09765 [Rhodobacterales bacterium HKCCE2091]|nr:hypothetical protein [Rhodobacterales bacterium HKCCE2091]